MSQTHAVVENDFGAREKQLDEVEFVPPVDANLLEADMLCPNLGKENRHRQVKSPSPLSGHNLVTFQRLRAYWWIDEIDNEFSHVTEQPVRIKEILPRQHSAAVCDGLELIIHLLYIIQYVAVLPWKQSLGETEVALA